MPARAGQGLQFHVLAAGPTALHPAEDAGRVTGLGEQACELALARLGWRVAEGQRGGGVAHQQFALREAEHGDAYRGVLQRLDAAQHRHVGTTAQRIGREQHHLAPVRRAHAARNQHHRRRLALGVERPLLAHDLALSMVGGRHRQTLAHGVAMLGEIARQELLGAVGMPEAQCRRIGPEVAPLVGVKNPQGNVEPVVVAQAGGVEKHTGYRKAGDCPSLTGLPA
mmetsp:Transcript_5282/g.19848  ORF Transcript_5282/g.19848 Transcript_5282/m.19848 type:complete len:225 (-) Transcript_5282:1126-1800(-)